MTPFRRAHAWQLAATVATTLLVPAHARQPAVSATASGPIAVDVVLRPTVHPRVPRELTALWFVPPASGRVDATPLAVAMRQHADGEYAKALPVLSRPASQQGDLGLYATYDMAVAMLKLGRADEARRTFQAIQSQKPIGYLSEAAVIGEAEANEALKDWPAAVKIYERLLAGKPFAPDEIYMRLGLAAKSAGDTKKSADAFVHVYYEFALSAQAPAAGLELAQVKIQPIENGNERFKLELGRALRLFGAKQYAPAKMAFEALRSSARGDDRDVINLKLAEISYYLKRPRDAKDGTAPFVKDASRRAEALYFYAVASRDLGDTTEYLTSIRQIVAEFPSSPWAPEALNNLITHHIVRDEDAQAEAICAELLTLQPNGPHSERAAWKAGWWAYRDRRYRATVAYFERAAATFPRSDYRPAWLYWAGRSREALGDTAGARERYTLVAADYFNSYYGRLAMKRPGVRAPAPTVIADRDATFNDAEAPSLTPPPANAVVIRALARAGLYGEASKELRYAQRMWGDSSAIQATVAWISYQQGLQAEGPDRFTLLRGSINTMRRAYPQFLAAGGERLPREILTVIFPLGYWDQLRKQADLRNLDPYLMAALMAQESTFVADVKSSANAVGLMQIWPPTGRQLAKKLGLRYSAKLLADPDANIRMGMLHFAETVKKFGAVHLALASYNAGESPVRRWMAERPGVSVEEFIDDIPYPETQNYVKRILGTAEDYRRLYSK